MKTYSRSAVARLFLSAQHLDNPRTGPLDPERLTEFTENVCALQLDSINAVERAHYLTVWSRFGPYDKAALDKLVYEDRRFYEYWAHAACLVPKSHLPAWRRAMLDYRSQHTGWSDWLKAHPGLLKKVEESVAERGPVTPADLEPRKRSAKGWWDWKPVDHALHLLWMQGKVSIHSRKNFHKRFDHADRVAGFDSIEPLDAQEFDRWHLRRSLRAMGAATAADLKGYLTYPKLPQARRKKALEAALKEKEVVELKLKDLPGTWYALAADLPALEDPGDPPQGTTFLSPFDSFLWYRPRTLALFDFDYKIEVYTPEPKRKFGYYTLPILHDGALIGRVDARNRRADKRLDVPALHFERSFIEGKAADRDRAFAAIGETLRCLAEFLGATDISLRDIHPRSIAKDARRLFAF